ncbi:hypothetical protein [Bacterioplanoides sp.]|uniref:hypothetical protein n=1 Tax=Bacterioplanoides sp. TaxID=2066072 RepID=UPI003AFF9E20
MGLKYSIWASPLLVIVSTSFSLEALDDSQLSDVTGEGLGATFDNVVLYSGDLGQPDDFEIKLYLEEGDSSQSDFLRFSELRLNKSGETPGLSTSGGRFGTFLDSFNLGTIVDKNESYGAQRSLTVWETAFPAADLAQVERSFLTFGRNNGLSYLSGGGHNASRYETLPNGFFPEPVEDNSGEKRFTTDGVAPPGSVNLGNLLSVGNNFALASDLFDAELDKASDKFDLHLRIDSVTDLNRDLGFDDQFFAAIDLTGLRLYGTRANVWARDVSEAGNNSGLAFALNTGLVVDSIDINSDPNGALGSRLSLEGVDAYLPFGTIDQPLTISTVQFRQQQRYRWTTDSNGERTNLEDPTTQLRIEIAALPQEAQQAIPGHITVRQLNFGDPDDPETITGVEDIYLRNSAGQVVAKVDDVKHRAFVPKTVTYNEEVRRYNEANPGANLPYIPNENVIELKGIEIQRLVITTQDLNRSCDVCITN